MAYDRRQFENLIAQVLKTYGLHSEAAVALLLGTAATESAFGTYLRQRSGGPALGAFQMEPATFDWLKSKYAPLYPPLWGRRFKEIEWDLELAILMARLRYRVVPDPLPDAGNVAGMAAYYKQHYNTVAGAATTKQFMDNYRLRVGGG